VNYQTLFLISLLLFRLYKKYRVIAVESDQALYEQAKADAAIEHRSIAGQIEFWARVGRAAQGQTCNFCE
jgi:hypothetical protein